MFGDAAQGPRHKASVSEGNKSWPSKQAGGNGEEARASPQGRRAAGAGEEGRAGTGFRHVCQH